MLKRNEKLIRTKLLQYLVPAIVMICKTMKDRFVVKNASVELMDIFHVTGIDRIIRFEYTSFKRERGERGLWVIAAYLFVPGLT